MLWLTVAGTRGETGVTQGRVRPALRFGRKPHASRIHQTPGVLETDQPGDELFIGHRIQPCIGEPREHGGGLLERCRRFFHVTMLNQAADIEEYLIRRGFLLG